MAAFAATVPFEFEQIMGSATQLAGIVKGGADEIAEIMPIIADLAAVSGLTIQQTTEQIVRAFSAGIGSADLFRERGVSAMLGFQAGATYSAEETRRRIVEAWNDTESKFRGASNKMATTWTGLMSMLSDRWFQFRNMVAEAGLFDALKGVARLILDELDELARSGKLEQIARTVSNSMLSALEKMTRGLSQAIGFIQQHPTLGSFGLIGFFFLGTRGAAGLAAVGAAFDELLHKLFGATNEFERHTDAIQQAQIAQAELIEIEEKLKTDQRLLTLDIVRLNRLLKQAGVDWEAVGHDMANSRGALLFVQDAIAEFQVTIDRNRDSLRLWGDDMDQPAVAMLTDGLDALADRLRRMRTELQQTTDAADDANTGLEIMGRTIQKTPNLGVIVGPAKEATEPLKDISGATMVGRFKAELAAGADKLDKPLEDAMSDLEKQTRFIAAGICQQLALGIIDGVQNMGDFLKNMLKSLIAAFVSFGLRSALGILSPSKLGIWAGEMIPKGIVVGVERGEQDVFKATRRLSAVAVGGLQPAAVSLNPTFNISTDFTPEAQAVNARWQRIFTTTARAVSSGGFRFED
jgi:hypothetical protein